MCRSMLGHKGLLCDKSAALVLAARLSGVAVLSLSHVKGFLIFPSIYHTLESQVNSALCLCELVPEFSARFAMDIDMDVESHIPDLETCMLRYFEDAHSVDVRFTWIYSDDGMRRWHLIATGATFEDCWIRACRAVVAHLKHNFPWFECDMALYKKGASLRLPMQCKLLSDGTFGRKLRVYGKARVVDLVVTPSHHDVAIRVVSRVDDPVQVPMDKHCVTPHETKVLLDRLATSGLAIPHGLRLSNSMLRTPHADVHRLWRVQPWHCSLCNRVHHSDNAYLVVTKRSMRMGCFRNIGV